MNAEYGNSHGSEFEYTEEYPDPVSRRSFLKALALGIGGVVVGGGSAYLLNRSDLISNAINTQPSLLDHVEQINTLNSPVYTTGIFSDLSQTQKTYVRAIVNTQVDVYRKQLQTDAKNLLGDQNRWPELLKNSVNNLKQMTPLVNSAAAGINYRKDSIFPQIALGMMWTESYGNPKAPNGGLFQLTDSTSADAYALLQGQQLTDVVNSFKILPGTLAKPDLSDPKTNITLALSYIDQLGGWFAYKPSLTVWAFNLGPASLLEVIREFLNKERKQNLPQLDLSVDPTYSIGSSVVVSSEIKRGRTLNYYDLFTSNAVNDWIEKYTTTRIDTRFYDPRVALGNLLASLP